MPDIKSTSLPAEGGNSASPDSPPSLDEQATTVRFNPGVSSPAPDQENPDTPVDLQDFQSTDPTVIFSHPQIPTQLVVATGMNDIYWSYTLNTVTTPTYGGEVIQILSVAIDDMLIRGQVMGYGDVTLGDSVFAGMETIYRWFLTYAQVATQGALGPEPYQNFETGDEGVAYNQTPITMKYPLRGWQFQIIPKNLPGFKYGRDVVAPEWMLQAAVVQPDMKFLDLFDESHLFNQERLGEFTSFNAPYTGWTTAGIGYKANNPFSAPYQAARFDADKTRAQLNKTRDYFNQLIPSYLENDFDSLSADFSRPVNGDDLQAAGNFTEQVVTDVKLPNSVGLGQKIIKGGNRRK